MTVKTHLPILTCRNCGHEGSDYSLEEQGQHTKANCAQCGQYIKFISKDDKYGTKEQLGQIWDKTIGRCCYCAKAVNPFSNNGYTIEHMQSQHNGGGHEIENLYLCCKSCNSEKGPKNLSEYRKYKMQKTGLPTFIFFFEELLYSKLGQNLKHYKTLLL